MLTNARSSPLASSVETVAHVKLSSPALSAAHMNEESTPPEAATATGPSSFAHAPITGMAMFLSSSAASSNDIVILPGMKSSGRHILSPPKDRSSIRTNSPGGSSVIPTRHVEICRSSGRNKYERRPCQDTTRGALVTVLTRSGCDAKMIWVRVLLRYTGHRPDGSTIAAIRPVARSDNNATYPPQQARISHAASAAGPPFNGASGGRQRSGVADVFENTKPTICPASPRSIMVTPWLAQSRGPPAQT